jgi:nucleotide-binding universal stress UspA family protein
MDYKKILVAMDMATKYTEKFNHALHLAVKDGAQLMLFCCLEEATVAEMEDSIGTIVELDGSDSQRLLQKKSEATMDHARAWLETLAGEAAEKGVAAQVSVEEGKPGPRICDLASHWGADLIVLGKSRRGVLAERLLGSISSHVAHCAPCSVLMTNEKVARI